MSGEPSRSAIVRDSFSIGWYDRVLMPNCVIAARRRLRLAPSTPQNSFTYATPMSALQVRPLPSKRACRISRVASTR